MANVEHSTLTGSNLHENKGVSSASDDFVATATSNATVWKKLTASNLTGTGNPFGGQLFHCREMQTKNVAGQAYTTGSTWQTVRITDTLTNEIAGASLASNQITLPAGTYWIDSMMCVGISHDGNCRMRLRNTTSGATILEGVNFYPDATATAPYMFMKGRFTLSGTSVIEVQGRFAAASSSPPACNFTDTTSFDKEVYNDIIIFKVA